ncbi:MAG TPA: acyl-CoA desaturase [Bacteroidia bacterium]|nr:acyl-CoA desaturase [Bacteroidia bacterium]
MSTIKFSGNSSAFYSDLKARVNTYFKEKSISTHGDHRSLIKVIVLMTLFLGCYPLLVFNLLPGAWSILALVVLGLVTAAIGFNIMHDGAHGSLSKSPFVNKLAALSLNMLGASSFLWNIKHNVIHHSFTNVDDHDDDILNEPFFRMTKRQPKLSAHKYQHLYFPIAYGLMYIAWVFFLDFKKYFQRRIADREDIKLTVSQHIGFWLTKITYIFLFVVLPLQFYSLPAYLFGYFIYAFTTGLVTSVVFQLAHTVEETDFIYPESEVHVLNTDWATHQVRTTANFATRNKFVTWAVGGLNFQVEHHLFPKIAHVHYPALSKIVKEVCQKYNLPYHEQATVRGAILSHIRFLRDMGRS